MTPGTRATYVAVRGSYGFVSRVPCIVEKVGPKRYTIRFIGRPRGRSDWLWLVERRVVAHASVEPCSGPWMVCVNGEHRPDLEAMLIAGGMS